MRISFNPKSENNYNPNFQMRLVEDASLGKYINGFHFKQQQDNLKNAVNIIKGYVQKYPENKTRSEEHTSELQSR